MTALARARELIVRVKQWQSAGTNVRIEAPFLSQEEIAVMQLLTDAASFCQRDLAELVRLASWQPCDASAPGRVWPDIGNHHYVKIERNGQWYQFELPEPPSKP